MTEKAQQPKNWKQKATKWFLEILVLIVLFNLFSLFLSKDMLSGQVKPIHTIDVNGETINNKQLQGETYLLYFWGSWCPICKFTKGNIQFLSNNWPVISFALSSGTNDEIKQYLTENELTFSTINDEQGYCANEFGVIGVPAIFIVNKKGDIIFAEKGYSSTFGLWLKLMYVDTFGS